jgi:hypothetical protein
LIERALKKDRGRLLTHPWFTRRNEGWFLQRAQEIQDVLPLTGGEDVEDLFDGVGFCTGALVSLDGGELSKNPN